MHPRVSRRSAYMQWGHGHPGLWNFPVQAAQSAHGQPGAWPRSTHIRQVQPRFAIARARCATGRLQAAQPLQPGAHAAVTALLALLATTARVPIADMTSACVMETRKPSKHSSLPSMMESGHSRSELGLPLRPFAEGVRFQ